MNGIAWFIKYSSLILVCFLCAAVIFLILKEIGVLKNKFKVLSKLKITNKNSEFDKTEEENNEKNLNLFLKIFFYVLICRVIFFIILTVAYQLYKNDFTSFIESLKFGWNKWDSPHYIDIAQNWYTSTGDSKLFIVFFPLYPMIIKVFSFIFRDYIISAFIVSNLSLAIACFYFYKLLNLDFKVEIKKLALIFLLVSPFSFFFSAIYTESLFLALSIACFYYIRKQRWFTAAVLGYFAALTRNIGVLLVIPYIIELLIHYDLFIKNSIKFKDKMKTMSFNLIYSLIIPFGTVTYLILNKVITGSYFTFMKYQKEHWYQQFGFFPNNLKMHFLNIFNYDAQTSICTWIPQVIAFFMAVILLYYSFNKIRVSYSAYAIACLIISYSPTWLLSGSRYLLVVFPLYISVAMLVKKLKIKYALMFISSILLFMYTMAFLFGLHVV